jgi:hypothetical protein
VLPAVGGRRTAGGALLDELHVGTIPGPGTEVGFDPSTGEFRSLRPGSSVQDDGQAIYNAAKLVAAGETGFITEPGLGASGRMALAKTLEAALVQGAEYRGDTPRSRDVKARSGAATISLAFMKTLGESDPLRARLLDAYVAQMAGEHERGLQGSMAVNLEAAADAGEIELSRAQRKLLRSAREAALPSRPPYDQWFADGENELNVSTFLQHEFLKTDLAAWKQAGFKVVHRSDRMIKLEGSFQDPDGERDPLKVNVKIRFSEKGMFRDMDDPDTQVSFYSGHSNLGGNVLGAIASGPELQRGGKWVVNWMCRGQQVISDFHNRFPDAHYMTTNAAATEHGPELLQAMFTGIAGRKSYDWISKDARSRDMWEENLLIWPNDKEVLRARDDDGDGVVTVGGKQPDALYNVGIRSAPPRWSDLEPVETGIDPATLSGEKVMQGVNFLNTMLDYHTEPEHPADTPIPRSAVDRVHAGGWFAADTDDVIRVVEREEAGRTHYDVQVNTKYKDQDFQALGSAMAYEFNRYISRDQTGTYTENDKLRGAVMVGHYLAYMADTYEEADEIALAVGRKYGFPQTMNWEELRKAMDSDYGDVYVSNGQQKDLGRRIGAVDPRRG